MKWFDGSIPDAIKKAKEKPSVLVVYISGQDDVSKEMDQTWEDEAVSQAAEVAGLVSLKLEAKSDACAQFSMIYPVVCVPCTFFVGNNGVPLEVLGGNIAAADFADKIRSISEQSKSASTPVTAPAAEGGERSMETESSPTDQQAEETPIADNPEKVPSTSQQVSDSAMEIDDKVERAKELLAMKQEQKKREEEEKAKSQEIDRRQLGQNMADLKKLKEEQQQKETLQEWKKEKEDQKKQRQHVKDQLEKDREERATRFNREKLERANASKEAKRQRLEDDVQSKADSDAKRRESARIQFRLPDGSNVTNQFPSSETLASARNFLLENVGGRFGNVTLSTIYPRRTFSEENMAETLLDLDLAPSAIIVVLPSGRAVAPRQAQSSDGSFVWMLLGPLLLLWNFICGFLFGSPAQPRGDYNDQPQAEETSAAQSSSQASSGRSRPHSSAGIRTRQTGNIRRLTAMDDDEDDDNATWNGNSTQQM